MHKIMYLSSSMHITVLFADVQPSQSPVKVPAEGEQLLKYVIVEMKTLTLYTYILFSIM